MKKPKKHTFKHSDPEQYIAEQKNGKSQVTVKSTAIETNIPSGDLKRTVIVIGIFIIILIIIYLMQEKTPYIKPVLKLFGL